MLRLLMAEGIKLRRDKALFWALLGLLGSPLMVTAMFIVGKGEMIEHGIWTTSTFVVQYLQMETLVLGPMILAVFGAQLITVEYRSQTLKSLLPLPTPLSGIIAAKLVWGTLLLALGLQVTGILAVVVPLLLGTPLGSSVTFPGLLLQAVQTQALLCLIFISYLAFSVLISVISKNFVVPLALSGIVQVAGLLALQGNKGEKVWTALPLMVVNYLQEGTPVQPLLLTAAAYTMAFVAATFLWSRSTTRPE